MSVEQSQRIVPNRRLQPNLCCSPFTKRLVRASSGSEYIRNHIALTFVALLYIHRNFFVRALRENQTNPTQSKFAPSFLTTYSSAIALLKLMQYERDGEHSFLMSQWPMWVNVVSSGVSEIHFIPYQRPQPVAPVGCCWLGCCK